MRGPRFGFIGLFVSLLIAIVAGVIGYNMGLSAGLATTGASGATRIIYAPGGFGFGGFGLLFGILFLVLIFSFIRRAAWGGSHGWSGRGGSGHYGGWGHEQGSVPPQAEPMFDDWHRRAHGEPTGQPQGQSGVGDAAGSGPGTFGAGTSGPGTSTGGTSSGGTSTTRS